MVKAILRMSSREIEDEVIEYALDRLYKYKVNSVKNATYNAIIDGILYAGLLYNNK